MASFYELTEDEVKLLVNALDLYFLEGNVEDKPSEQEWRELKDYLETRERGELA